MMIFKGRSKVILAAFLLVVLLVLVYLAGFLVKENYFSGCDSAEYLNASLTVAPLSQKVLGFNTDTDSLKFGKVSPLTGVRREVRVNHSLPSKMEVSLEGPFWDWVQIDPPLEYLQGGEVKTIVFYLEVPALAEEGDYFGRVKFCFREE